MVHSFTFPQEMIDSIQERIKFLERCLNDPNPQDEAMAEIRELANSRQISISQLRNKVIQLQDKLNKFIKLVQVLKAKDKEDKLSLLLFVRYNFLFKEILDQYWDFIFIKPGQRIFLKLIIDAENLYKLIQNEDDFRCYPHDEQYILKETTKHLIQSLIKVGLRISILTEEEAKALKMEDIIPQESEAMLISLASTKKWDQVYRNLA
jgi:hypothetical protein